MKPRKTKKGPCRRKKKAGKNLTIRLELATLRRLMRIAEHQGRSLTETIARSVEFAHAYGDVNEMLVNNFVGAIQEEFYPTVNRGKILFHALDGYYHWLVTERAAGRVTGVVKAEEG